MATTTDVLIVGAGPVGLFTVLRLAQGGIQVTVVESRDGIDQSPRAIAYFPSVLEEFEKAGILQNVIDAGVKHAQGFDWRDVSGNVVGSLTPPPDSTEFAVILSQPEFGAVLLERLRNNKLVKVLFGHTFERLEQNSDKEHDNNNNNNDSNATVSYWVRDQKTDQVLQGTCRYLVGADGGRSTVRRAIDVHLEGYTFESLQFVAVNFQCRLEDKGWKRANFFIDPVDWAIIADAGKGPKWRMATGVPKTSVESLGTLDEATVQTVKDRLNRLLPGKRDSIQYEAMAPYTIHQRCASTYRVGNVLLAGDAAHLNNPVGGLGLTTGILDAAHLALSLTYVLQHGASPVVLEKYAQIRRSIFRRRTDPMTTANLHRLIAQDPTQVQIRNDFLKRLNDPTDMASQVQIGLPDFALTTTSDTKFDTTKEVCWFISVSKPDDWTRDQFLHEYKTVHANMTTATYRAGAPIRRYLQVENGKSTGEKEEEKEKEKEEGITKPTWDFVTVLTMASLFTAHVGLQQKGYKETAGAHIFCKLDQEGCFGEEMAKFSRGGESDDKNADVGPVRSLRFHQRTDDPLDDYTDAWFEDRGAKISQLAASDSRVHTYVLWKDATPKNTEYFFRDTQFSGGNWHKFKAVEAFDFADEDTAKAFFNQHKDALVVEGGGSTLEVVGDSGIVF